VDTVTPDEELLLDDLDAGRTIVVNLRKGVHDDLLAACRARGALVRIDRATRWGNPYAIPRDGNRAEVIRRYRDDHLPTRPDLLDDLPTLRGRALACWCAPEACHGNVLAALVDTPSPVR